MKNCPFLHCAAFFFSIVTILTAQETIDENELFSNTETIIPADSIVNNAVTEAMVAQKKTVGISGEMTSGGTVSINRAAFKKLDDRVITGQSAIVANLMLDIRQPGGIKAFGNLETIYSPEATQLWLRELFVDMNWRHKIFVRTGKQNLQWGRCFFWNPSDLINVEKKLFVPKIGYREGAYGIKVHIPSSTRYNIYSFIDTKNATSLDSIAGAAKFEFLVKTTEIAAAFWYKPEFNPVYTIDFSTRLFKVNIYGESSISYGANTPVIKVVNDTLITAKDSTTWWPRFSLTFTKSFGFLEIKDRISLTAEFYYNSMGYSSDILSDRISYPIRLGSYDHPAGMPPIAMTKRDFLLARGLYEQHNHSRLYAAFFTSMGRFIHQNMTLTFNAIGNLDDRSAMVALGLQYRTLNELTLGMQTLGFLGHRNREYTFMEQGMTVQVTAGITF